MPDDPWCTTARPRRPLSTAILPNRADCWATDAYSVPLSTAVSPSGVPSKPTTWTDLPVLEPSAWATTWMPG
jgi:hypothetical protein